MGIQKIWLSTFRVLLGGQELLALNVLCEVLRQVKYLWGKLPENFLVVTRLGVPCGSEAVSVWSALQISPFALGVSQTWAAVPHIQSSAEHTHPACTTGTHRRIREGDTADTAVPPEMMGFSCSCFKLRGKEHCLQEEGVWRSQFATRFTRS